METDILFKEEQRFKQWWLWALLGGLNLFFIYGVFQQLVLGQPFGDNPMGDTGLVLMTVGFMLMTLLFATFRLETEVRTDGIYVRFFPFQLQFRRHAWEALTKAFVRSYQPLREYGGWGIRYGLFGQGRALNISGNQGLQLEFADHSKLLIGTNQPENLAQALQSLHQLKP
jgi:hypothetical protein